MLFASAVDVASVWALVSEFVEKQMLQRKVQCKLCLGALGFYYAACRVMERPSLLQGVSILNLGTFSFATKTVDIGNNRSIAVQRPVFLLSEKFAQTHCIRYAKQHTPGECVRVGKQSMSTGI